LEYSAFDVKGILMFEGSHVYPRKGEKYPLYPQDYRTSWRILGDPEVLNPDGYTFRWSPWYDSGSDKPIFNYIPGRFSSGEPTANINAYLDFWTHEERHLFVSGGVSTRSYHIWLPPGPVVAGYAVEACWLPPKKVPVEDPIEDFPISANQPEAYHFNVVVNDGKPVTVDDPCCLGLSVHEARAEMDFWYLVPETFPDAFWIGAWSPDIAWNPGGTTATECDGPPNWRCMAGHGFAYDPDGLYQFIAFEWHVWTDVYPIPYMAVDLFEVEIDMR